MKSKGANLRGGILTTILFVLAAGLLLFSVVGSSRAALNYYSETYSAQVEMYEIGVSLRENDTTGNEFHTAANRDHAGNNAWDGIEEGALTYNLPSQTDGEFKLDYRYKEELKVLNSGQIDEYVRVTIYRYWEDADGKKLTNLSPDLIDLEILTGNGWIMDGNSTTKERTVLYYQSILGTGKETPLFADHLTIHRSDEADDMTAGMEATVTVREVKTENGQTVYETVYDYGGIHFILKVEVDAVQTHNAAAAIKSAWGVNMTDYGIGE